jgi:NADH:ubiquinone oxidoreductase subunit C
MINDRLKRHLVGKFTDWYIKNPKRIYVTIKPQDIHAVAFICFKEFKLRLCTISGVDNETDFELLYHFSCDSTGELFNFRVCLQDRSSPSVQSLTSLFHASNWVEREIYEMLGIKFLGHPNLKRLLLDDDWPQGNFPLRKKQD